MTHSLSPILSTTIGLILMRAIVDGLTTVTFRSRPSKPFSKIGTTDFYELVVEDGMFADKSMLIDEILLRLERVILIAWPPGFGKSLNADMLRRFLEIETDERGRALPETKRINRALFFGGRINYTGSSGGGRDLKPLEVTEWNHTASRQGTYPVVFLSLAGMRADNFGRFLDEFQIRINRLYRRYAYIESNLTESEDRSLFREFLTSSKIHQTHLEKSLFFLTNKLEQSLDRKPFIIVDDYDGPFVNVLPTIALSANKTVPDDVEKTAMFVRSVLRNGVRLNSAFDKAVLTSRFPSGTINLISRLDEGREFNVLAGGPFSEYYGFTQDDVNGLLDECELWGTDDDVRRWYGGYTFGGTRRKMYNPISIMRTLQANATCTVYWTDRSDSEDLNSYDRKLIEENKSRAELKKLLAGESVGVKIASKYSGNLTELFFYGNPCRYLLFAGYLAPDVGPDGAEQKITLDNNEIKLKIPTHEIKITFEMFGEQSRQQSKSGRPK